MHGNQQGAEAPASAFTAALLNELVSNAYHAHRDNIDLDRFPPGRASLGARSRRWLKGRLQDAFHRYGYVLTPDFSARDRQALASLGPELPALARLHERLGDDASRELLVKIVAYRTLGSERVKLPLGENRSFARRVEKMRSLSVPGESIALRLLDMRLERFDLRSLGYPLTFFGTAPGNVCTFDIHQYDYPASSPPVRVERGDVVLDCGGCWGDTTLYFAHASRARVFVFEFIPSNIEALQRNLAMNPEVTDGVVEIVRQPVWSRSGRDVFCDDKGPASRVSFESTGADEHVVKTIAIDDLARDRKLERLDFIKMDIEGAELDALAGAAESIRRFRPKLAISVYHRPTDLTAIPRFIDGLGVDYDMYLGHYTMHAEETVLFARPRR
jgi:FkbM family methyltransferase